MLQIAANPYVTILGPERTASSRLNLSQAFNSFGTTIGPIIGGWLIFTVFTRPGAHGADSVKIPYLGFAAVYRAAGRVLRVRPPAELHQHRADRRAAWARSGIPHTVLGMIAIFMYVGGEVSVGSAIINFLGTERLGKHRQGNGQRVSGLLLGRPDDRPVHGGLRLERHAEDSQAHPGGGHAGGGLPGHPGLARSSDRP